MGILVSLAGWERNLLGGEQYMLTVNPSQLIVKEETPIPLQLHGSNSF